MDKILIFSFLQAYQLPAIAAGSFLFGEMVIIIAAFLSAQGVWSIVNVFLLSLLGTVLSDMLYFLAGRYLFNKLRRRERFYKKYEIITGKLNKIAPRGSLAAFIAIKFLYGTRIIMIIHFASRQFPFKKFFIFDFIAAVVWLAVIIGLGWLAGAGALTLASIANDLRATAAGLLVLILIYKLAQLWIKHVIIQPTDKK